MTDHLTSNQQVHAPPLLRLENLTISPKKAPERLLVNDVSFTIQQGKTTCVVGESGSGKKPDCAIRNGAAIETITATKWPRFV